MLNRILTLRRKRNETSEIRIDFSIKYAGSLSKPNDTSNNYVLGNGVGSGITHSISIFYREDINNRGELTISEDGILIDSIVIEDSDVDSIVIEDSDVDSIVIEDSDVDSKRIISIKIPISNDDFSISSRVGTMVTTE